MNPKQEEWSPAKENMDQKMVSNGKRLTAGSLQQLEVGDSTVEVLGNGRRSFLHIVNSNTPVVENIGNEHNEPNNKVLQETHGYAINVYLCSHCPNRFRSLGTLRTHERACSRRGLQEPVANRRCKDCRKVLSSVSNLQEHMKTHFGIQPFRCNRCYRKYYDESLYSAHMDRHKRQEELVAKGKLLSAQDADKQLVVKEFKCLFCNLKFTVVFNVGEVKRRSTCDACRQKYNSEEALRPSLQRGFVCNACGRKFALQGFMQRHQSTCDGTLKRIHRKRIAPLEM